MNATCYLAAELFVKAGACALENWCTGVTEGQDYDGGQHHATHTHVRVRSRVGTARLRGGACMRAWGVREVINCETHGAGARLRDLCKVPVHIRIYGETVYI